MSSQGAKLLPAVLFAGGASFLMMMGGMLQLSGSHRRSTRNALQSHQNVVWMLCSWWHVATEPAASSRACSVRADRCGEGQKDGYRCSLAAPQQTAFRHLLPQGDEESRARMHALRHIDVHERPRGAQDVRPSLAHALRDVRLDSGRLKRTDTDRGRSLCWSLLLC